MSIAPNPADPRVRRTRQLLLQAFMELLLQRSFESITVQDIAERATVNRATFYAHFEDKFALLDSLIHEQFRHALEQKLPGPSAPPQIGVLYAIAGVVFDVLSQMDGHCRPTDEHAKPLFALRLQREIRLALLDWLPRMKTMRTESLDLAATTMSWALLGAADQWNRERQEGASVPAEQAARQAVDLLLAGVARALGVTLSA